MRYRVADVIAVVVTMCLLGAAAGESWRMRPPADAAPYHASCRASAASVPRLVGDWVGRDLDVPTEAITLLRPNVLFSRAYANTITGHIVSVLIVQCDNARNLTSHYPPICYPTSRGMEEVSARPRQWNVDGLAIRGTEYEFRSTYFGFGNSVVVQNFILMPSGEIVADMEPVKRQSVLVQRYYGAGQVQLVFDPSVPGESRDRAFVDLMRGYRPLIESILGGKIGAEAR